jgi:hypothetical protein
MALRYWVGGTANWDGTAGTKWSATSGGAGGASVPTVADDVFFDSFSPVGTVVTFTAGATVGTINFTGFPGEFKFGSSLLCGNTTLSNIVSATYTTNATVTSYSFFPRNVNSTFTANGKILPVNLVTYSMVSTTLTLAGNADFQGNFLTNTGNHNIKAATGTTVDLRIGGNIDLRAITVNATDHVTIKGYGTSKTFFSNSASFNIRCNFVSGSSYTSAGSSALSGTCFLTVEAGGQFNAVSTHTFSNNNTTTISGFNASNNSDFFAYIFGTLSLLTDTLIKSFIRIDNTMVVTSTGGSRLLLEGNWNHSTTASCTIDILEFTGTTTTTITVWSSGTNLQIKSLTINKTGGGSVVFNPANPLYPFRLFIPSGTTYSWTHTSGTVTQSSTSVIFISGQGNASQLNYSCAVPSFKFSYLEINGATINLSSTLNCSLLRLSLLSNTTFTSPTTFGFIVDRLQAINTSGALRTITLKSAVTYSILNDLLMLGGGPFGSISLLASTAPTKAIFNLENSAQQQVELVNPTNIDSSGNNGVGSPIKQTIYSFNGTITTTFNWGTGIAPTPSTAATVGYTFVN